jgi:tyramine---L-glutamate ligase
MVRVFVYEFVTGGGFLSDGWGWPPASLLREGTAMAGALAADFAAAGVEVFALRDDRLSIPSPPAPLPERERGVVVGRPLDGEEIPAVHYRVVRSAQEERSALAQCSARCDWTIVIAPETSNALLDRCRQVEAAGGRLIGPGPKVVALASDKHATIEHLVPCQILIDG